MLIIKVLKLIVQTFIAVILPAKFFVWLQYRKVYGRYLHFESPKTLSEKINILKLRKQSNHKIVCSDKVTVKDYIKNRGLRVDLIPNLDVVDSFFDIKWDKYPRPYIVKVSNGSGQQVIIYDNNIKLSIKVNFFLRSLLRHYIYAKESVYSYSKKRFIIEPYLSSNLEPLNDYKVYCFNGVPKFIQINDYSKPNHGRMMIDEAFKYYPYPFASGKETSVDIPDVRSLNQIMELSADISIIFDFVRIDYYIFEERIYLGEMTFYPMGGYVLRNSNTLDVLWGSFLNID